MTRTSQKSTVLRQEAENVVALLPDAKSKQRRRSTEELLHELQVHQVELEMQNEELRLAQVELEASRDHFVDFYDFAPVGYLTLDSKNMISEINLTGAEILGAERNRLVQHRFAPYVSGEDRDRWHRYFLEILKSDKKLSCELALKRGDGSLFYAQLDCLRMLREDQPPVVRIVLTDITARKRTDEIVREQEEFFRMIAEHTDDLIAVLDLDGRRIYNSPSYARLFGETGRLKGTDSFGDIHPDDRERIKMVFRETVRNGAGLQAEYRFVLADGSIRHMESRGCLIRNGQGNAQRVVVFSRDITERKLVEESTSFLAFHDPLTKLPNRRLLDDRLEKAIAGSKRSGQYGALLFLDLDNFKPLNDAHGHRAGDLLLEEVARRLVGCVREVDTVARFGGDEFIVVLNELDEQESACVTHASAVAGKIRNALAEQYWLTYSSKGTTKMIIHHHCTACIGVALFNSGATPENVIKLADMAMYKAKEIGANQIRFHEETA